MVIDTLSVKASAYELCKDVHKNSHRAEIKDLLSLLENGQFEMFGHEARRVHAQFLGYLLIQLEVENGNPRRLPFKIPSLSSDQKSLIFGVQKSVVDFNLSCLNPLTEKIPDWNDFIPYQKFGAIDLTGIEGIKFFSSDIANSFIRCFHAHPALIVALDLIEKYPGLKGEARPDIFSRLMELAKSPFKYPDEIINIRRLPDSSPERIFYKFFSSLIVIRESLLIANQLLYQAVLQDKLPFINEKDTVYWSMSSRGAFIVHQNMAYNFILEPSDLILIGGSLVGIEDNLLCSIETTVSPAYPHNEVGMLSKLYMRRIDKNLNPYIELMDIIEKGF